MPASSVDAPPPAPRHATTETSNSSASPSPSAATLRASTRAPLPMYYARVVSAPQVSDSSAPPPQTCRHAAPALTPATLRTAFEGMQALKGVFGVLAPETATLGLASSSSSSSSSSTSASAPVSWTPKAVHARNDAPSSSRSSSSSDPTPSSSSNPTPSASSSNPNPSTSSDLPPSSSFPAKNEDYGDIPTNKQLQESLEALFAAYRHQVPRRMAAMQRPQPIPEKCFTWCSQRNDGSPMCRMMCLRRRPPLPTKEESLARLRPGASSAEASTASVGFFAGLRNRLMPYSLIFVKGTPEGVVGRYMEELEGDDGQYDFGPLSRHAPYALRRKSTGHVEYLDWGADVGYILQVPLTSLFAPIINLPENVARVLGPSTRLLERAVGTITDGTQARAIEKLAEEIQRGSAVEMLGRIQTHYVKKMVEAQERQREARARAEEAVDAAQTKGATGVKPPVKDKEGKGE